MRIDFNNKYCLISSTYELTLYSKSKDKKEALKGIDKELLSVIPLGHCNTLGQACKTLLDTTIKQSTAINDMKQLETELKAMKADIDKTLKPFDIDEITKEFKRFDNVKFNTDEKEDTPEIKKKPSKIKFDDDEEDKEYDASECGKSIF